MQPNEKPTEQSVHPMQYILTANGSQMVMSGPLSQAYCDGLDELYAKERTEDGMALETQAVDVGLLREKFLMAEVPALDADNKANLGLFYGVQRGTTRLSHVVDIVSALEKMRGEQRQRSAVIIDAIIKPKQGQPFSAEYHVALEGASVNEDAIRARCKEFGVPVYNNLYDFVRKHK